MSTILCETLEDTALVQQVNFKAYRKHRIPGVQLRVVYYNSPVGTFNVEFKSGLDVLGSGSFTTQDIKDGRNTTDDYGYVFVPITFNNAITILPGSYTIELSSTGYTYSSSSFMGWVKSFENLFNEREDEFVDFSSNPFDVLIYEERRQDLVR